MRWAAWREPPADVETYFESARPRLARSLPPEPANRVKLLRAPAKRCGSAVLGIGGRFGGTGGVLPSGAGWPSGLGPLGAGEAGAPPPSASPNHEGTSGVPPPGPP